MKEILLLYALNSSAGELAGAVALNIIHEDENISNRVALPGRLNFYDCSETEASRKGAFEGCRQLCWHILRFQTVWKIARK